MAMLQQIIARCQQLLEAEERPGDDIKANIAVLNSLLLEHNLLEEKRNFSALKSFVDVCVTSDKETVRLAGLKLLCNLVDASSEEQFGRDSSEWHATANKFLKKGNLSAVEAACHLWDKLLVRAHRSQNLYRQFSQTAVPSLLKQLLTMLCSPYECAALTCLIGVLERFPAPCSTSKSKLDGKLMAKMCESGRPYEFFRCVALLAHVGNPGLHGSNYDSAWGSLCDGLLAGAHACLEKLYHHWEVVDSSWNIPTVQLSGLPLENDDVGTLATTFTNICQCLCAMLSTDYGCAISIPLHSILALICRTAAVTGTLMERDLTSGGAFLLASLPALHEASLALLASVTSSCKSLMEVHSEVVIRLILQILAWTRKSPYGDYSGLRTSAWNCLDVWMHYVGLNSCKQGVDEEIVAQIMHDVTPLSNTLMLQQSRDKGSSTLYGLDHRKKRKMKPERRRMLEVESDERASKTSGQSANALCLAALNALKTLIYKSGQEIHTNSLKKVHNFIISQLLDIQKSGDDTSRYPELYNNARCRHALYDLLLACILVSHPKWASPLQPAVEIFYSGFHDPDWKVSCLCIQAQATCKVIINPSVPSLQQTITKGMQNIQLTEAEMEMPHAEVPPASMFSRDEPPTIAPSIDSPANSCSNVNSELDGPGTSQGAQLSPRDEEVKVTNDEVQSNQNEQEDEKMNGNEAPNLDDEEMEGNHDEVEGDNSETSSNHQQSLGDDNETDVGLPAPERKRKIGEISVDLQTMLDSFVDASPDKEDVDTLEGDKLASEETLR